ncbi:MAG: hypothetical protein M1825_004409 [Sarcosagium campestre]|nr:MAG: hypothetical protein M1825_004409 [Sarcosagium campestre]
MPRLSDSSDDESDIIPGRQNGKGHQSDSDVKETKKAIEISEDESEPEGEEEYVVEKILKHAFFDKGVLKFLIKWKGYTEESDQTWEPESSLEGGADDVLAAYYRKIGGKPVFEEAGKSKKRRKSEATPKASNRGSKSRRITASESPPAQEVREKSWAPPNGSWEQHIQAIETIENSQGTLLVYIQWNDGHKSRHPLTKCHTKCPQTMLRFYEQHLVFKEGTDQVVPSSE